MRISWNWLGDYVSLDGRDPADIAQRLTVAGLEVEGVQRLGEGFSGVVVAEVRAKQPHPKAQKLTLVQVWDGQGTHDVVCGAPNVPAPGGKVLWARPGAVLPGGREIGTKELQGVRSAGMICSETELQLGEDASGIMILGGEDAGAAPGTSAQDALALRDVALEVNVTTNRPDCLSHVGLAREVAALTGQRLRRPDMSLDAVTAADRDGAALCRVALEDDRGCPRYVARVIEGLKVQPSRRWLRRRLEAVGVRPINNLVDVTNYVMFEVGQPLHAFDYDRVTEARIVVRRAKPAERMTTLDGLERALEPGDLLICDGRGPVALAGVMGGAGSDVAPTTARVLLESATFEPVSVRRTAKRLGLHSEASHRFERGVDPNGADFASARAARLLAELGDGRVARGAVDAYPRKIAPRVVDLRPARAVALTGMELAADEMARTLGSLELGVETIDASERSEGAPSSPGFAGRARSLSTDGILRVSCPTFRPDLEREVDLIDEIARMHLDRMPATLPSTQAAPSTSGDRLAEAVRDALASAGLAEAITFGFTSPARIAALRFPEGHPATRALPLANPLREEHTVMRTSLLPNLLQALAHNLKFGVDDVRIFEVGHVFLPSGATLPDEPRYAAAVLAGERSGWLKSGGPLDFFDAKGVVEHLFAALGLPVDFAPARSEDGFLHPGVAASVLVGGEHAGVVGEVHPETRDRMEIERRCFALELNLERLPALPLRQGRPVERYPAVVRDVSFFVDDFVPAARVRQVIEEGRPPLLESVRVLDDYREAGKVPQGKKGMLWSMTYRSPGRTLTDAEVDALHEALVVRLLAALGAERR